MELTSKERLSRVLRHQPVDMVPVEVRAYPRPFTPHDRLSKVPEFAPLVDCMLKEADNIHFWNPETGFCGSGGIQVNAEIKEKVEGVYSITSYKIPTPKGELNAVYKFVESTWGNRPVKFYIETAEDVSKLLSLPYTPPAPEVETYFEIERRMRERGIMQICLPDPLGMLSDITSFEQLYLWIKDDPQMVQELLSEFCRRICSIVEELCKKIPEPLFWFCGPEMAVPPWAAPSLFDSLITRYDSKIFEIVHKYNGLVRVHCHGFAMQFLKSFKDMGVDAIEPLEPPPLGDVILKEAKKIIGDTVCLCGNLPDLDGLSLEEVDRLTRQAIEDAASGSGFILTTAGAAYHPNVSPVLIRNLIRMVHSGRQHGQYKGG